jgi:hypothetical protein
MPREIDVDAILADAKAETEDEAAPGVLRFRGESFEIRPRIRERHLELAEAFEIGNQATILRELFGQEGYVRLRTLHPDNDECSALISAAAQLAAGLGLGESSRSEASSPSTSEPSEPTSEPPTG